MKYVFVAPYPLRKIAIAMATEIHSESPAYDLPTLARDLRADIETYLDFASEYESFQRTSFKRLSALLTPSVIACAVYRVSHWLYARRWERFALAVAWFNLLLTRVSICPASRIGGGLYIPHPGTAIVFEGHAGRNLRLFAGSGATAQACSPLHRRALKDSPVLGDNILLGYKALVLGPVNIGAGCRIGINAVVTRDLAPGTIALATRGHTRSRALDGVAAAQ